MASTSAPAPWQEPLEHLSRQAQRACEELGRAAEHLRREAAARLPGRAAAAAAPAAEARLDAARAFLGGGAPPAAPATRLFPPPGAAPAPAPPEGDARTREEVGRATWLLLHTLAAQLPERPSRRQRADVRALVDALTRVYPCGECARHFAAVVRASPPATRSRADFARWLCDAHNVVNRSLGKPAFNCELVDARWGALACGADGAADACTLDLGAAR